ncbi:50S ribosomal protein L22 [uncultured Ilumatobacter sp.]|jgi:large subunit ribosomal protein L22|uniref:50S ribosomal protein L22 n=1 Tax=Ilumatobacter sp. TaxID=1967498 RepID=UPI00374E9E30|tara:strand:- start:712 stop:1374 length:663 start_codon:yes stop_codon:yes gene_type:complete
MTGPKLNEKSYVAGERSGTKATAKYVRTSASKVRVVLDLVRGLDVKSADQILQLTERHTAIPVRKLLASAVANAVNNDNQDADELYVIACFADEGPTLKRFKPRARGRASRILKRTCHVTIIVARMSDARIAIVQARAERQGAGSGRPVATSRRDRVARSKEQAADAGAEADAASDAIAVETEESPLVADSSMPGANQDNATEEATDTASDTAADKPEEN